jgi:hypothetical protein
VTYCSAYVPLIIIFIFCSIADGKSETSHKCTTIHLEMKTRMICKYDGGHSLSAITRELGLAVSTENTFVKDAAMHKRTWKKNANHEVDITYKEMGRYNE